MRNNGNPNLVWKLKKALYGLKQAPRQWHKKLREQFADMKFVRAVYDAGLFVSTAADGFVFVHVDDLFFTGHDALVTRNIERILEVFQGRDLGELSWALGMKIIRDLNARSIAFSQARMIENVLARFDMAECKAVPTPLETNVYIGRNPHDRELFHIREQLKQSPGLSDGMVTKLESRMTELQADVTDLTGAEHTKYMQLVGAIQYIAVVTRPDISFAAALLARYMSNPTSYLMKCGKRVLRYLSGTRNYGLSFTMQSDRGIKLLGYADADYAGCCDTRKATSGMAIFMNDCLVKWRTKRQPIVSVSTTEAELISLNACALDAEWLRLLLTDDIRDVPESVLLYCDNQSAQRLAKDPIASDRTKHIEMRHRKIQELVDKDRVCVDWISTRDQVADIFTKQLDKAQFEELRKRLGVCKLASTAVGEC